VNTVYAKQCQKEADFHIQVVRYCCCQKPMHILGSRLTFWNYFLLHLFVLSLFFWPILRFTRVGSWQPFILGRIAHMWFIAAHVGLRSVVCASVGHSCEPCGLSARHVAFTVIHPRRNFQCGRAVQHRANKFIVNAPLTRCHFKPVDSEAVSRDRRRCSDAPRGYDRE